MVALSAVLALAPDARAADAYDYCSLFPGARTHVFLLDRTARYSDEDQARMARGVSLWFDETVRPGDRVVVHTVADYVATSLETFNRCVPACPPKGALPWYDSCNLDAVEADQAGFRRGLLTALDGAVLTQSSPQRDETALVEVIYTAAEKYRPQTLTIFSDFMEFHPRGTGAVNFYKAGARELRDYMAHVGRARLLPDLKAVAVTGYGLRKDIGDRPRQISDSQWSAVYRFWVRFFQDAGAAGISLETEYKGRALPPTVDPQPAQIRSPG